MSNSEGTSDDSSDRTDQPMKNGRYKEGASGNAKGRPRDPATLKALFHRELYKVRPLPTNGRRLRRTAKEIMVRSLVESAAKGDRRALNELIELINIYGERAVNTELETMSFAKATERHDSRRLRDPDAFFHNQDRTLKNWQKHLRHIQPMSALLKRELDRKVDAFRAGKPVKVRMRDAIVAAFIKEGIQGTPSVLRTILNIVPEKKYRLPIHHIVERPTPEEKEQWLKNQEKGDKEVAAAKAETDRQREMEMARMFGARWRG